VRVDTALVDADAVERGLRARLGDRIEGWQIEVEGSSGENEVAVTLVRPDASRESRRMTVEGVSVDDRSRELAAALALVVDQYVAPETVPETSPRPPRVRRFFLGIGPRVGVGAPPHPDLGASFAGGGWLAGEHLMPRLQVTWSGSWDEDLFFHGVRFGAGLGAGAPLGGGRWWLGAFVVPQAAWVQARDAFEVERWVSSSEVGGLLQLRFEHLVIGLRTGVDVTLPPLRARGRGAQVRWGTFRYMAGLTVGPRF
jgi:hypothetical protein